MFEGLIFKVASDSERLSALEFRRQLYREELGHEGIDEYDDLAHQLIVSDEAGEILAAMRIVDPGQRPFDLERFVTLSQLVPPDRSPGDVGRLCIRRDRRQVRRGTYIHFGLLKLAVMLARHRAITDLLTMALPHLQNLYRGAYFKGLKVTFDHPMWGPVYPMRLDLVELKEGQEKSTSHLTRVLFDPEFPNFIL